MSPALALALTLAVEGAVAGALAGRRGAAVALAASLLTHPFAWAASQALPDPFWRRALIIEGAVVLVEAGLYQALLPTGGRRALGLALAANGASFAAGLLWWWLVHTPR